MKLLNHYKAKLLQIDQKNFEENALSLFYFQAENNPIYKKYLRYRNISPENIEKITEIPFLPIQLFKNHVIKTGQWATSTFFESSGTTGTTPSRHYVEDHAFYLDTSTHIFENFFGALQNYHIMALLPSYLERKNASLVAMIDHFIQKTNTNYSGFYLKNFSKLNSQLAKSTQDNKKTILFGVSFSLLDFIASGLAKPSSWNSQQLIVIETGGMKGRRKEIIREELHTLLKKGFNINQVHAEYGMTELLSQAYAKEQIFTPPPWMKVYLREQNDPTTLNMDLKYGGINIIDLANVHSCAFIETQDLGKVYYNGNFEILGRIDHTDLRGCNLMLT